MNASAPHHRLRRDFADARKSFGGMELPRIPYSERTRARLFLEGLYRSEPVARAVGGAADLLDRLHDSRDPGLPPRRLQMAVGGGDYRSVGEEFRGHFVDLAGLEPHHDVLDVGSGSGRMAFALKDWLTGTYEGFDVVPAAIEWCQREIASRHPNFRFQLADIRSERYNPGGARDAAGYRFAYPDDSFDFALLTSVFTHLPRAAVGNYLGELARVLRPGGRCLATYFLMNDDALRVMGGPGQFGVEQDGQLVVDERVPERAVAFPEDDIRELHERNGLPIESVHYGSWCGRKQYTSFQDITISIRS
ncbi:MAG TPA: class I SAM-dependent methyltransferase [Thermoleophilaceae bacterium]|nr:class I SAM-dependent methyltransferase [Thermoleophilaceae bacterium]